MLKFLKHATALTLSFALFAAVPLSVNAQTLQFPNSYDFNVELVMNLDVQSPDLENDQSWGLIQTFLQDVKVNANGTFIVNDINNPRAFQMHTEMEMFAGSFYLPPTNIWLDFDMRDMNNFVYKAVVEIPASIQAMLSQALGTDVLSQKYWVIDFGAYMDTMLATDDTIPTGDELNALMDEMFDEMGALWDLEALMAMMPELVHAGGNNYTMTMDDEWLAGYLIDFSKIYAEMMFGDDSVFFGDDEAGIFGGGVVYDADVYGNDFDREALTAEFEAGMAMFAQLIRNVGIFSQDLVVNYQLDSDGYPLREEGSFEITIDIDKWMRAFADAAAELDSAEVMVLPGETTDVVETNVVIVFGTEYTINYENVNNATPVTLPRTTPQNSVDLMELMSPGYPAYPY